MFIERSAGRIRLARIIFVAAGLAPCLLLAAWAIQRGSAAHRDAVRSAWQVAVGLPLDVAAVTHPRPGVMSAAGVVVRSPAGRPLFDLPAVEVESAAHEDRLTIRGARLDAAAAAALGALAREWLRGHARHPRNCVIELSGLVWADGQAGSEPPGSLRIECVAQEATRAIRVVGDGGDEIRTVRTLEGDGASATERFVAEGRLSRPMPAAVLLAAAGFSGGVADAVPPRATILGDLRAEHGAAGWSGSASGRIDGLDLGRSCAAVMATGAGSVNVAVNRFAWRDGRLVDVAVACDGGPGWVDTRLFDRLVIALGCRPGPAHQPSAATQGFDAVSCAIELDGSRVAVRPAGVAGGLAAARGGVLLEPPGGPVAFERFAWMASPPAATFVPAAGPGAWLMSIVPAQAGEPPGAGKSAAREGPRGF